MRAALIATAAPFRLDLDVRVRALFAVFVISGVCGLIYESIWSHYLKLFVGHAAYAQTIVLIVFIGGMALGAWLIGRFTDRIASPLIGYAMVEGVIGLDLPRFSPAYSSQAPNGRTRHSFPRHASPSRPALRSGCSPPH